MPLTLHVAAEAWRAHQRAFVDACGGPVAVVPVVKGNGYGPGRPVVAAEAGRLGVPAVAVGTYDELADVAPWTGAHLLVLTPWRPGDRVDPSPPGRVVHTASRVEDLRALAASGTRPPVVVEVLTSMRRFGVPVERLGEVAPLLGDVDFRGWALHLPLSRADTVAEGRRLGEVARAVAAGPLWVSHVAPAALPLLGADVRLRTGSQLWLGGRHAMRWTATVLDVHPLRRGETYGYRQRRAPRGATLVVAAGGTSHGIGLDSASAAVTLRQRAIAVADGVLDAAGRPRSPYRIGGRRTAFAEQAHMQVSMLWAPRGVHVATGDELDLLVRYTTTVPDVVAGL